MGYLFSLPFLLSSLLFLLFGQPALGQLEHIPALHPGLPEPPPAKSSDILPATEPQSQNIPPKNVAANPTPAILHPALRAKRLAQASAPDPLLPVPQGPARRGLPAPLDPIFPGSEWVGADHQLPIGVPDTGAIYPLEKALWKACPLLRKARIRVYGWGNPGYGYSSSRHSNIPLSYAVVPRKIELDQAVLRVERVADTVQREHMDWGFRVSALYGIDYRFTTAQGWYPASRELLYHNNLYGFDPVELYGTLYIPKVAKGMTLKFGRYISPPDIEAQLAPDNYLWTHSQMFTVDCYTQTGILASIKLNDQWTIQGGIHAGDDIAPWNQAAIPTGQAFVRWTSKSNNDSIYGGVDSINNGQYRLAKQTLNASTITSAMNAFYGTSLAPPKVPAHDNLQQFNITWGHRWNKKGTIVSLTEAYYLYQFNALQGGTVNNGPPHPYYALTGPGKFLPHISPAWGVVNYTAFKISKKDFITIRPVDFLGDCRGQRTGFPTTYSTWTVGLTHRFNDLLCIRPEIRYERALNYNQGNIVKPYDNGTRRYQFTFGLDLIQRF